MNKQTVSPSCRIRVYLLGPLEVARRTESGDWRIVSKDEWGKYRKAGRRILGRLLSAPGRRAGQGRLLDDLWPETESKGNLDNGLTAIRNVIGEDLLTTIDVFYEVAGQDLVWVDLDACKGLLKEAENQGCTTVQVIPLLEEAQSYLERGECFEGEEGQWRYGLQAEPDTMLRQCRWWLAQGYEQQGKLWQAGEQYRAMILLNPSDEEALQYWLEMLYRHGKWQEALKCYQDMKDFAEAQGFPLSPEIEQAASSLKRQPRRALFVPPQIVQSRIDSSQTKDMDIIRRQLLDAPPGEVAVVHHAMSWPEDLLQVYREGVIALYDLYLGGKPAHASKLLPLYVQQTASLVAPGNGVLTRPAARLASLAQQLVCELGMDQQDYGTALRAGQQALQYAEIADDRDLQVASLIKLGSLGYHRRDGVLARKSYEHAIALGTQDPARVTPLLRARCYSGIAQVYAMCDMPQEAYRAMGKAYESYPMNPENDPAYPYLRASRFALYVYGDCQTRLFLGQPNEAAAALEALEHEGNRDAAEEPITYLDLLSNYAEIRRQLDDLDAATATLTEAAQLSRDLGSRLYFNKLAGTFHELRKKWPHESLISSLDEMFQPW